MDAQMCGHRDAAEFERGARMFRHVSITWTCKYMYVKFDAKILHVSEAQARQKDIVRCIIYIYIYIYIFLYTLMHI